MSLTPYDTGERAQPMVWAVSTKSEDSDERDRFGKVDFDNTEEGTLLTTWVEDAHGTVTLQVLRHLGLDKIVVDTQGEGAPEIVVDGVPQVGAGKAVILTPEDVEQGTLYMRKGIATAKLEDDTSIELDLSINNSVLLLSVYSADGTKTVNQRIDMASFLTAWWAHVEASR